MPVKKIEAPRVHIFDKAIRLIGYYSDIGITASTLGAELWGKYFRVPQSYARPAGKILKRLKEVGTVHDTFGMVTGTHRWHLTAKGYQEWERIVKACPKPI